MGPWDEVFCSGPLRATLPTEVVTVSMYVMPVISSLMMQLMLMVANPGTVTTPLASRLEDTLGAISSDSSFFKQAITPRKLQVGIVGWTTSSSCTSEEGFSGVGVLCRVAWVLGDSE